MINFSLPKADPNKQAVVITPKTWNSLIDVLMKLGASSGNLNFALRTLKMQVTRRWFAELNAKQIEDIEGDRVIKYSAYEFEFAKTGDHRAKEDGHTTRNYALEDDFAEYLINLDEVHRRHVKHTGLILSETEFLRPVVEVIAIGSTEAIAPGDDITNVARIFSRPLPELFVVELVQQGGAQGGPNTPATYTYEVKDVMGETLNDSDGTPMAVERPRGNGRVDAATKGVCRWDPLQTELKLMEAWETPKRKPC